MIDIQPRTAMCINPQSTKDRFGAFALQTVFLESLEIVAILRMYVKEKTNAALVV